MSFLLHHLTVDFIVSLIAIDTDGAALVVSKITIIRAVVALDVIFAILESIMPAFAIAGVVIVKDDIVSVLSVHNLNVLIVMSFLSAKIRINLHICKHLRE